MSILSVRIGNNEESSLGCDHAQAMAAVSALGGASPPCICRDGSVNLISRVVLGAITGLRLNFILDSKRLANFYLCIKERCVFPLFGGSESFSFIEKGVLGVTSLFFSLWLAKSLTSTLFQTIGYGHLTLFMVAGLASLHIVLIIYLLVKLSRQESSLPL